MVQLLHKTISVFPNVYLIKNISHRTIFKTSLKIPKGVIRIRKSKKDTQHNGQRKGQQGKQTPIYNTLHIKLKIE